MMREKYESLSLGALKDVAKARGLKGISSLKKSELIERMLQEDEKEKKTADKRDGKHENKKDENKKEESQETRTRQSKEF